MAEPTGEARSERALAHMMGVSAMVGALIDELVEAGLLPAASLAARLELAASAHAELMPEVSAILSQHRRAILRPPLHPDVGRSSVARGNAS